MEISGQFWNQEEKRGGAEAGKLAAWKLFPWNQQLPPVVLLVVFRPRDVSILGSFGWFLCSMAKLN